MEIILRAFLFIALLSTAHAEPPAIGVSAFGLMSKNFKGQNCMRTRKILKASDHPAIAVLWQSFGREHGCLKQVIKDAKHAGKRFTLVVHFSNEVGRRNGDTWSPNWLRKWSVDDLEKSYQKKENYPNLRKRIHKRVFKIRSLVDKYSSDGTLILSTGLEDDLKPLAWKALHDTIKEVWPYEIARSANNNTPPVIDGVYHESHGYKAKPQRSPCILNGDGHDLVGSLGGAGLSGNGNKPAGMQVIKKWIERGAKKGCVLLFWSAKHQGFGLGKPLPASTIDREFRVDGKDVSALRKLIKLTEKTYAKVH